MKPRICLSLLALSILATAFGCRTDPRTHAYIESLNAEKRALEDRIYALEYDLEIAQDERLMAQEKYDALRGQPDAPRDRGARPKRTPPPLRGPAKKAPPGLPDELDHPQIDLGVPEIDPGKPLQELPDANTPDLRTDPSPPRSSANSPQKRDSDPFPSGASRSVQTANLEDPVTQVYLNPFLTGGADFDGQPGDDGLTVVLEPRNAAGRYVPLAGSVVVVLLDPANSGDDARVARWDLDTVEVSRFLKNTEKAQGLHLRLPWNGAAPRTSQLRLFARYTSADGEQLEAEQDVYLTRAERLSERWTPKTKLTAAPREFVVDDSSARPVIAAPPAAPPAQTARRSTPSWRPSR